MSVTKADVFLSDMAYKERLSLSPELRRDIDLPPDWEGIATSLDKIPDESSEKPDWDNWDDFERWARE